MGEARLSESAPYPAHREADVALRDGSTARVRPARADDRDGVLEFYEGLSPDSRAFRFMSGGVDLGRIADAAVDVDYRDRYGLVAVRGAEGRIVGHGSYARIDRARAEVAFAIADELQGRGVATILLAHLAEVADENGIAVFEAEVLPANHRMVEVFRQSGFPVETSSVPGSIHVELPTTFSGDARERFQLRDQLAAAAAVQSFLEPRSVAVIGASRRRGTVGGEIFHNLLDAGFQGVVHPVNPSAGVVQSVRAYPRVTDVPGDIDLAVIAVPGADVVDVARDCAAKRVAALVVVSAGFAEIGEDGMARQRELVDICRAAGMRLVGPNCLGILNTNPSVALNATFAPDPPPPGNVGFLTQSGALGLALIGLASDRNLGLSSFASIGNRADVTGNDLLEYWESDEGTDVALLYIESFSDPRRFSRVARRVGAQKPIIVVKSGRSRRGRARPLPYRRPARCVRRHGRCAVRAGRRDPLRESRRHARRRLDAGEPAAAGGAAGRDPHQCGRAGDHVRRRLRGGRARGAPLPDSAQEALREFLAAEASLGNPVDMIATASADQYRRAIATLGGCEAIDALIVIFVRPLLTRAEDVAREVRAALDKLPRRLPAQAVFMSAQDHAAMVAAGGVPTYLYPEDAARALARVRRYADWTRFPPDEAPEPAGARGDEAAALIADALAGGAGWLGFEPMIRLLDCYGIAVADWRVTDDPAGAGEAAADSAVGSR